MATALERHGDGNVNFDVRLQTAGTKANQVLKGDLKDALIDLFANDSETALFFFAGHGHINASGGYILSSDSTRPDDGVTMDEILNLANKSPAKNKVIILDSCHSGLAGSLPSAGGAAVLQEGLTILTASTKDQYATEKDGEGVFTSLFVDALNGAAADLRGEITPGSIYAHIDQSLGSWEQRPIFKTNVKMFVSLRKIQPRITTEEFRRLTEFFPSQGATFKLDPSFEPSDQGRTPDMPEADPENTRAFAILQKFNRVNLVVPIDAPHMWHAAMLSKSCGLTALGAHYRRLVERNRI